MESARSWHSSRIEWLLHEIPTLSQHGSRLPSTWMWLLAGPTLTAESPNTFCGYWSTEKSFGSNQEHCCSFVFLTHVTLAVTLFYRYCWCSHLSVQLWEEWLQIQDDNQDTQICTNKHRYTRWTREVTRLSNAEPHTDRAQSVADWAQTVRSWPCWEHKPRTAMMFHWFFLELFSRNFLFPLEPPKQLWSLWNLTSLSSTKQLLSNCVLCSTLRGTTRNTTAVGLALWGGGSSRGYI